MSVTDQSPESAPFSPLPQRRPAAANRDNAVNQAPAGQALPERFPARPDNGAAPSLPRRNASGRPRRTGRHRSMHRISVASDAPALVLAVPGRGAGTAEIARHIAETAAESCRGVDIRIGYLSGKAETLTEALADVLDQRRGQRYFDHAPHAVVVPLLAGPHPGIDPAIARTIASAPVMLATALGPHPLLAGALHDRLYEAGLVRASRARGLNIAAGQTGIMVVTDRGHQAIIDAGVTTVLLASRLAIPAAPASLGDAASIDAAVQRLREAGATRLAIAPCVVGPETDPGEFAALSAALKAPCAAPLGGHPAIAQLVAVRYGEALTRITVASH
jgi:hypothetical protein